jgi:hypothetical protein
MNPEYFRFVKSIQTADHNVTIICIAVLVLLLTYKSIDWYPVRWQMPARIAAQIFAVVLLSASIGLSL